VDLESQQAVQATLKDLVTRAKAGDEDARNQLIHDYLPFVLKVTSQKARRYVNPGQDDEVSVAMLAFNEAIDAYVEGRGNFLSFSQTVIQRRLVDYYRREKARDRALPLSQWEDEEETSPEAIPLLEAARAVWQQEEADAERRRELEVYEALLRRAGLSFNDLVRVAPKHRDTRMTAIALAREVASRPDYRELVESGEVPTGYLVKTCSVSRRLVERHRSYIVSVALILSHDFPYLQEYLAERGSNEQ